MSNVVRCYRRNIDQLQNSVTAPSRNMETRLVVQKQKDVFGAQKRKIKRREIRSTFFQVS